MQSYLGQVFCLCLCQREIIEAFFFLAGVLLFGPPGCGKTMIAKATAKASGCKFINLQASTLTDMWYGESQKLTAAVFSLAVKIQPCIIFIDEIGKLEEPMLQTCSLSCRWMDLQSLFFKIKMS